MKHHSTRAAALLVLSLAGASALAKVPAIQTLPKGQLYEQRDVSRSKAQCRERVLARGSFEGVYEGEECGEGCSAVFRLDSGEKVYLGLSCNADKLYGPEGRRSLVHFEVRREWYEYAEQQVRGCSESMFCVAPPAGAQAAAAGAPAQGKAAWPGVEGDIIKTLPFRDRSGENTLILSSQKTCGGDGTCGRKIFAYRFLKGADGAARRLWRVYDFEEASEFDLLAAFYMNRVAITDLDKNGTSEVWLPYALGCLSDPSQHPMKIIMYEGTQKYAMRGLSRALGGPAGDGGTMDAALRSGPAVFRSYAQKLWQSIDHDYTPQASTDGADRRRAP